MKAINIKWDVENEEDLEFLPDEIDIPADMEDEDEISDYISEYTGFCHFGFELVKMDFETLLNELRDGKTFEEICSNLGFSNVECNNNEVYEDDDLNVFLHQFGAEIFDYGAGYAVIMAYKDKWYELPYEEKKNRFGDDLPDETILYFNINKIYDVSDSRK